MRLGAPAAVVLLLLPGCGFVAPLETPRAQTSAGGCEPHYEQLGDGDGAGPSNEKAVRLDAIVDTFRSRLVGSRIINRESSPRYVVSVGADADRHAVREALTPLSQHLALDLEVLCVARQELTNLQKEVSKHLTKARFESNVIFDIDDAAGKLVVRVSDERGARTLRESFADRRSRYGDPLLSVVVDKSALTSPPPGP